MRPYLITAKLMRPSNMKSFPTPGLCPWLIWGHRIIYILQDTCVAWEELEADELISPVVRNKSLFDKFVEPAVQSHVATDLQLVLRTCDEFRGHYVKPAQLSYVIDSGYLPRPINEYLAHNSPSNFKKVLLTKSIIKYCMEVWRHNLHISCQH
jgi:hypothetical protein